MDKEIYKGFHGVRDASPGVVRGECVIDATLPDYEPEIRRIFSASATARPSGKYVAGGKAECAGTVVHTVFCQNADGGVSVLSLPGDYLLSLPAPDGCDPVLLPVVPDAPICRLTGPRRLSIRTPLSATARCYEEKESSPALPTLSADPDVIPLIHAIPTHRTALLSLRDVRIGDTVRVEGETKVLASEATACVRDAAATPSGVDVRGECEVVLKLDRGDGVPSTVRRRIPFSETLPWEGEPPANATAAGWASVSALDVTPADGEIALDLTLDLTAEATSPVEEEGLVDLFSLKEPLSVKTETIPFSDVSFLGGSVFTVEGDAGRSECNCEDAMTVIGETATVSVVGTAIENDLATVSGECRVSATVGSPAGDPDGGVTYSAANFRFPFSVSLAIPATCAGAGKIDTTAIPLSVTVKLDASRLLASVELAVTVRLSTEKEAKVVSDVGRGEGDRPAREKGEIVAVYPDGNETLWEIARRYGVPPEKVARENGLADGVARTPDSPTALDGVVRLLIE